jgi:hypothetical protein
MGRIGRWISTKIQTYIIGIIESRINEKIQVMLYGPSGDDSPPIKDDRILIISIDGTGKHAVSGVLSKSQGANPGEKKLYSRDSTGTVKAIIYIKNDGTIELNTGDASSWVPNTLSTDPMTGVPHGGITAGIIKLKGA